MILRFREYKIGFDDLVEQAPQPADLQPRQPFTPLENLPPMAPRVSKTSPHHNKINKESSKSSRNGPGSVSSIQRSYGNISLNVEGSIHTLPRNLSNKSLSSKGLRRDKSVSVQDLNEAPLNAAVNVEDDRRSDDGTVHNALSHLNLNNSRSTHSSAKEERMPTPSEHPRFFDFPGRNERPKKDDLIGWMEALEMSLSEDGSDCSSSSIAPSTRSLKIQSSKSFNFNNKENKVPKTHLSFVSKSNDKTKKRMNREESARRPVASEKDYKLSLVIRSAADSG